MVFCCPQCGGNPLVQIGCCAPLNFSPFSLDCFSGFFRCPICGRQYDIEFSFKVERIIRLKTGLKIVA